MNYLIQVRIRWSQSRLIFLPALLAGVVFFILTASSCNSNERLNPLVVTKQDSVNQRYRIFRAFRSIVLVKNSIQSGDIITRTGNDFTSESIRNLNQRDKTYSHSGIASIENDSLFVYHAIGGEWNPEGKLRRDPFELFAEPFSNRGIGIYRFTLADTVKQKLYQTVRGHYLNGLIFDMDFDLESDKRMYCAEFIYKSFLKASNYQIVFNHSNIGEFIFIGVDDIFLHPFCKMKKEIVYK